MEKKIDLSKYPKGSVIKLNAKGIEFVEVPYDNSYEKKMNRASSPKINWKQIKMHG